MTASAWKLLVLWTVAFYAMGRQQKPIEQVRKGKSGGGAGAGGIRGLNRMARILTPTGTAKRVPLSSVQQLGKDAVDAFNEEHGRNLEYHETLSATRQLVSGLKYSLCIRTQTQHILVSVWVKRDDSRQFAFASTSDDFECSRDPPSLPSLVERVRQTHQFRPHDSTPSFDLREKFPQCKRVLESYIDQGVCGCCAAVSTLTVIRDMHCIHAHDTDPARVHQLEQLYMDVPHTMSCASQDDSRLATSHPMMPTRSMMCEGGINMDYVDHALEHGVPLIDHDINALYTKTYIDVTLGVFRLNPATQEQGHIALECGSLLRSIQGSNTVQNDAVFLLGEEAHIAFCKEAHRTKGFDNVSTTEMLGLSAAFPCADAPEANVMLSLHGYNVILPEVAQMKHALRFGPLIIGVTWFKSFEVAGTDYGLPPLDNAQSRVFIEEEANALTEEERRECVADPFCDYSVGEHAVVFLGWSEEHWIVRNSHSDFGDDSIALLHQRRMNQYVDSALSLHVDGSTPCQAVLTEYRVDGDLVTDLGDVQDIVTRRVDDATCSLYNPNEAYEADVMLSTLTHDHDIEDFNIKPLQRLSRHADSHCCLLTVDFFKPI